MELSFGMDPEDRERELFTENSAQALLIASLKDERDMWQELHSKTHDQLSDTQRQNAELMQLVDSMREALEAIKEAVCGEHVGRWDTFGRVYAIRGGIADACDIAIAASKVSNDGDGKD